MLSQQANGIGRQIIGYSYEPKLRTGVLAIPTGTAWKISGGLIVTVIAN